MSYEGRRPPYKQALGAATLEIEGAEARLADEMHIDAAEVANELPAGTTGVGGSLRTEKLEASQLGQIAQGTTQKTSASPSPAPAFAPKPSGMMG